jgi:hypothetical protein
MARRERRSNQLSEGHSSNEVRMVPLAGLEPARLAALDFESSASTNFTTGAL